MQLKWCAIVSLWGVVWLLSWIGRYIYNVVLSVDQLGNSLLLGDPDETISSRIGRIKRKWGGTIPWTRPVAKITDWLLEIIDPGHSERAIEDDEGKDGLIDKPGNPYSLSSWQRHE